MVRNPFSQRVLHFSQASGAIGREFLEDARGEERARRRRERSAGFVPRRADSEALRRGGGSAADGITAGARRRPRSTGSDASWRFTEARGFIQVGLIQS
jgi:hypothetical protein